VRKNRRHSVFLIDVNTNQANNNDTDIAVVPYPRSDL
jgi:hypothetical protein